MTPRKKITEQVSDENELNNVLNDDDFIKLDEIGESSNLDATITPEIVMNPTDPGWTAYVLSHFEPDELVNSNPTTAALRRVTEKLYGIIVESTINLSDGMTKDNFGRVTAQSHIGIEVYSDGRMRYFGDIADACKYSCDGEFAKHLASVAATRAEGRALRKALKLTKIVSAEEIAPIKDVSETEELGWEPGTINDQQINVIDMIAAQIDIDVFAFINSGRKNYTNVSDIPHGVATLMIKKLNEYRSKQDTIPVGMKGYSHSWRS